jgi:hypothetical protein
MFNNFTHHHLWIYIFKMKSGQHNFNQNNFSNKLGRDKFSFSIFVS